jgi:hypothetical protein
MKLPRSSPGRLSLDVYEIADQERPPMSRIPEYAERHADESSGPADGTDDGPGPDA